MSASASAAGYSLPIVMFLSVVLASGAVVAVLATTAAVQTSSSMIARRQVFYQCDSMARIAAVKARQYFASTRFPNEPGLQQAVCGAVGSCPNTAQYAPAGFVVDEFLVTTDADLFDSGEGEGEGEGEGDVEPGTVSTVPSGPFKGMLGLQNQILIEVQMTKSTTKDRCHVQQTLTIAKLGVFEFFIYAGLPARITDGVTLTRTTGGPPRIHVNGDFCVHAGPNGNTQLAWVTASGRVLSRACSGGDTVSNITMIDDAFGAPRAIGSSTDSGCIDCASTRTNWRVFALRRWRGSVTDREHGVPDLTSTATSQAGFSQQLKALADLRIIDGVWYRRDPLAPNNNGFAIGYEERNYPSTGVLPVVSYGTLAPAGPSTWVPGFHGGAVAPNSGLCGAGGLLRYDDPCTSASAGLLQAARGGFQDRGPGTLILPLNFDVARFLAVMSNTAVPPGSAFGVKPNGTRDFNGAVWIEVTGAVPIVSPTPGFTNPTHNGEIQALPQVFSAVALPACATAQCNTQPNAVRVYNASVTSTPSVQLMTVGTSLPLYALGDVNVIAPNRLMLTGSAVTLLSREWTDVGGFALPSAAALSGPPGTTMRAGFLTGMHTTDSLPDHLRRLETNTSHLHVLGALAMPFASTSGLGCSGCDPDIDFRWDDYYGDPKHTPPGAPVFFVQAIERWARD